jgi:hypothetical protein
MRAERFSARTLDAGGSLDDGRLRDVLARFEEFGALHVQNTGLRDVDGLAAVLGALGFGEAERFAAGGRTSAAWQEHWVVPGLRRMDHYPPSLYLLPNNEVQYRRSGPQRVLFYCRTAPRDGGRTFVHSAAAVEAGLGAAGSVGTALLEKIDRHGLMIETGFLDRGHPRKKENYFQSWQERFGADDPDEALARARSHTDEYDRCWWQGEDAPCGPTLMTRITLRGFKRDATGQRRFLRFPRLALDAPSAINGYRRFPLGDGSELSSAERALLLDVYLATREGTAWEAGDLILFDNVQFGHSRESFSGEREVFVAMAGEVREDAALPATPHASSAPAPAPSPSPSPLPSPACAPAEARPIQTPRRPVPRYADGGAAERYALPAEATAWTERFAARTFDAGGSLSGASLSAAREQFARHGVLHLRNTGLRVASEGALPDEVLDALGFGERDAFPWGGMSSGRTTRRALSRALRATDDYPAGRWLLPHNEVLYQRTMPARLLFFSAAAGDPTRGGRTFVHEAARLEAWLRGCGPAGEALLGSLRAHGLLIEMGFLDERHPEKARNYFRSWQDRFETDDRDEALARCRAATLQFDEAWWRDEPLEGGAVVHTLMTRIRVPAFCRHPGAAGPGALLLFPRVALDGPSLRNGHRVFPKGNGEPFTDEENDLLLAGFLATREGMHYGAGDILLVDNLRYGHSRESFEGPRGVGVAMAGEVLSDDAPRGEA